MPVALKTFRAEYDGDVVTITKDISRVAAGHELARRFPHLFGPDGASRPRRAGRSRPRPTLPATKRAERRVPPRSETSSWSEHVRRRTAKHEAAHAVAAHLLGWSLGPIRFYRNGDGLATMAWPKGLDGRLRRKQFAVIAYAADAQVGWTANQNTYDDDNRKAYDGLCDITTNSLEASRLQGEMRAEARALVGTPKFKVLVRRLADKLFERGDLSGTDVRTILEDAAREERRQATGVWR